MDQLQDLARLEFDVAEGRRPRLEALAEARSLGIPDALLDALEREPGRASHAHFQRPRGAHGSRESSILRLRVQNPEEAEALVETATTRRLKDLPFSSVLGKRPLTRAQTEALFAEFSKRIGVEVRLAWDDESPGVWVDWKNGGNIEIPGGIVRTTGVNEDTLAVIVAHELSHIEGKHKDEARADYEATRHGLRRIFGPIDEKIFFERAMLGAYGLLVYLSSTGTPGALQLRSADEPRIQMNPSGYPTLQSRWDLMKAGILGAPMLRESSSTD